MRFALLLLIGLNIAAPLYADAPANPAAQDGIAVTGAVEHDITLPAAQLAALARHAIHGPDKSGAEHIYEGVYVNDVVALAKPVIPANERDANIRYAVLVTGRDGFSAAFALAEVEPALAKNPLLLVDRVDGAPLNAATGPWRVVIVTDKKPERWVRQVAKVTLIRVGS